MEQVLGCFCVHRHSSLYSNSIKTSWNKQTVTIYQLERKSLRCYGGRWWFKLFLWTSALAQCLQTQEFLQIREVTIVFEDATVYSSACPVDDSYTCSMSWNSVTIYCSKSISKRYSVQFLEVFSVSFKKKKILKTKWYIRFGILVSFFQFCFLLTFFSPGWSKEVKKESKGI